MTEKELLYIEDAIGHEQNIISIINESLKMLEDENLISFMEEEKEGHLTTLNNLISKLKEEAHE